MHDRCCDIGTARVIAGLLNGLSYGWWVPGLLLPFVGVRVLGYLAFLFVVLPPGMAVAFAAVQVAV